MTETTTWEEWTPNGIHSIEYRDAEGRLHREDGPAHSEKWPNGYRYEAWHWHDKKHRIGGPAVITTYRNGTRHKEWWENDKFVREERTPKWRQERDEAVALLWRLRNTSGDDSDMAQKDADAWLAKHSIIANTEVDV